MPDIKTTISQQTYYMKMGSGPVLILLHGFPESSTLWRTIWDELSASYTLIMPDFPGSGESVLERDTTISEMAECVAEIMDHENIEKAVIAGHSMGGYVAFAFAELFPQRVAGLSLVHSIASADNEEKKVNRQKAIDLIQKGGKSAFIRQMVPNLFTTGFKQSHPAIVEEEVELDMETEEKALVNYTRAMMNRKDQSGWLDKAPFPMQWIIGGEDNIINYKKILDQSAKSGTNFVSFYNNCGHMSMFEAPVQLVSDLGEFVNYCYEH